MWPDPEVPNLDPEIHGEYFDYMIEDDPYLYDPIPLDTAARLMALGVILQDPINDN